MLYVILYFYLISCYDVIFTTNKTFQYYSEITSFVIENDSFEYQRYFRMYVFYLGDDEHREIDPACTTWEAGYYYLYK